MAGNVPSTNGTPHEGALPPVEPPNARFILQLFLVPLILVAVFGSVVYFLFGWIGVGTSDPSKLLDDLDSGTSERVRWAAAQDLSQVLPRDARLRGDTGAALRLCGILQREMGKVLPADQDQMDFLKFLPAAVSTFQMPVGVPLLQEIVVANHEKVDDEARRERLHSALAALGKAGSMLKEFAALPREDKDRILNELQTESAGQGDRAEWARRAYEYLTLREEHRTQSASLPGGDPYGIAATLTLAARSPDELTRGFAIVALGNWQEPGIDLLLRELASDNSDLTQSADGDLARARREIRQTAALALARRGSPLTPWHIVLETLDEQTLRTQVYVKNNEMATAVLLKSIRDLRELREKRRDVFEQQGDVKAALNQLTESPSAVVQVEARKLLGGTSEYSKGTPAISREFLLVGTMGVTILFLLALGAVARWRRKPAAPDTVA